ncbi:MAG: ABC transporter ATP-binding protein [Halobacteriota archaeon]|uniref:ABC transporter ATP-binding protein n=1 Tax=Natronomonas sp. TaxID=2184060 RepID=UPI0039760F7F
MSDTPLLRVDGVSKSFGAVDVLRDVSFSVPSGTVIAVIGPNGSGKTTLLRALVGDLRPTHGDVAYEGPDTDRPIGYLPQQPTFRAGFTAAETLAFYSSLLGGDDPETLLGRVGLNDAADRNVENLSGGMRQLLGIAQATVGDPPLVVLDEPASGLDPNMSEHVFETAARMAGEKRTVLLSSHDLTLVEETADDVLVLNRGRVAATGTIEALRSQFETDSLRGVLNAIVGKTGHVDVVGDTR